MQHARPPSRPPTHRSRVTNGSQLARVDNRSAEARRYKDLICIFAAQFNIQTDTDLARVETAAGLKIALETLTAKMINGEAVDEAELARLSREWRAVLSDLKRRGARRDDCCDGAAPSAPTNGNAAYAAVLCDEETEDD